MLLHTAYTILITLVITTFSASAGVADGEKATKIYESFFKNTVGKEIPTEEANCLIGLINSLDENLFKQAVKPLSQIPGTLTFDEFNKSVAAISFFPNGKLSNDFSETQPVAQMVEMMSKNSC